MSEIADLIKVMQEQMQRQEERHQQEKERHRQQEERQEERHKRQLDLIQKQLDEQRKSGGIFTSQQQTPPFPASIQQLNYGRTMGFKTVVSANSVPDDKLALVFLTNQTSDTYKLINNYALQQDTPTTADNMQFSDIAEFMSQHYDPTKFTVRSERDTSSGAAYKRKPGETPTELVARVRQMATTCDFPDIKNPLDEAMRTCFICAINNEAVLKSMVREPEEKLTFPKAVEIATEVEE